MTPVNTCCHLIYKIFVSEQKATDSTFVCSGYQLHQKKWKERLTAKKRLGREWPPSWYNTKGPKPLVLAEKTSEPWPTSLTARVQLSTLQRPKRKVAHRTSIPKSRRDSEGIFFMGAEPTVEPLTWWKGQRRLHHWAINPTAEAPCKFGLSSEVGRNNTVCSSILTAVSVTSEAASCSFIGQVHFALFGVTSSIGWPRYLHAWQGGKPSAIWSADAYMLQYMCLTESIMWSLNTNTAYSVSSLSSLSSSKF